MELFFMSLKDSTYKAKEIEKFGMEPWQSLVKIENDIVQEEKGYQIIYR